MRLTSFNSLFIVATVRSEGAIGNVAAMWKLKAEEVFTLEGGNLHA